MIITLPRLSFILVFLLWILQMIASNQLATRGAELGKIEDEMVVVKRENAILSEKLAESGSLERIAQRAVELGLVTPDNVLSVTLPPPLAMTP